jgi:hypothetical protein
MDSNLRFLGEVIERLSVASNRVLRSWSCWRNGLRPRRNQPSPSPCTRPTRQRTTELYPGTAAEMGNSPSGSANCCWSCCAEGGINSRPRRHRKRKASAGHRARGRLLSSIRRHASAGAGSGRSGLRGHRGIRGRAMAGGTGACAHLTRIGRAATAALCRVTQTVIIPALA